MYYVYSTYVIGRKEVIKEEEGVFPSSFEFMGKTPSYICMKEAHLLWKQPRICHSKEKFSNLAITVYYPSREFVFKIPYSCISTTSVGAVFCLVKIETEKHGKPP